MNKAIEWLINKAAVTHIYEETTDGPKGKAIFFKGQLPYRMCQEIKTYVKANGTIHSHAKETTYSLRDGDADYSFAFGAYKSTQCNIKFSGDIYENVALWHAKYSA